MTSHDEQVARFRRRTERIDDTVLQRNLKAGVYGPPGSARRSVAEAAIELRSNERAQALQLVTAEERTAVAAATTTASKRAARALWISIVALLAALVALAGSYASM